MHSTIDIERKRLELLQSSTVVGICYLDGNGKLVQEFDDDPQLREAILEYQRQRLLERQRSDQNNHQLRYQIG